ncbi:MAG TPA: 4Fe-4S binding protein, partial [Syntrophales bacterium]|nr:4Fe-4S binding protein [Syntrophales bacterium]
MLGASLVGICTPIIYYGYQRITKIIEQIDHFMERKNHESKDIIGIASPYVGDIEEFGKLIVQRQVPKDALTINVNSEKCTGCGRCAVCNYGAIVMEDKLPQIALNLCERCGVCESICPTNAIIIQKSA